MTDKTCLDEVNELRKQKGLPPLGDEHEEVKEEKPKGKKAKSDAE